MTEKVFFSNSKDLKICGILEQPFGGSDQVVIIVHGFSSNKDRSSASLMAEELSRRGLHSFRIDLDGCGESEGKFENQTITSAVDDLTCAIELMRKRGYNIIDLFGSSAGGLAVMATAVNVLGIHRIGLQAPVSDFPQLWLQWHGQDFIDDWKARGYAWYESGDGSKRRVNYSFLEDSAQYIMYQKVRTMECPVLIIHGTKDAVVGIEQSRKVVEGFRDGRLIELEGADHALAIAGDLSLSYRLFGDWFERGHADL